MDSSAIRTTVRRLLVAGVVMAGLVGCREQPQITRQTIPKQESIQLDVAASTGSPAADAVPEWELPPGWRREPSTSTMRFATLRAGDVEFSVIPLPFPDGEEQQYLLSNINRWRGQLQMPVLDQLAGETEAIDLPDGSTATLVDLEGWQGSEATGDPTHRMLAAIIRHGDKAWFFKRNGQHRSIPGRLGRGIQRVDPIDQVFRPANAGGCWPNATRPSTARFGQRSRRQTGADV